MIASPRKLEHQVYHGAMVSSALVESDVNTTHYKINVDDPVITLMEGAAFRMPFVLRLLGKNDEHCVVYTHRLRPGYQGRARRSIPEKKR